MSKRDIETLWDDVRVWLGDATRSAIKEAEDLTRRGRLKVEIFRLSREMERAMARLGARVYEQASKTPDEPVAVDAELKRLLSEIARLESELRSRQREYEAETRR
jgi:hypothetical protein